MPPFLKDALWGQLGAAIDMLENAIRAYPEALWSDRSRRPEAWYLVFHTLFWLDLYLSDSLAGFAPPPPFTLDELDPDGKMPERVYTQAELLAYLEHGRRKARQVIAVLDDATAARRSPFDWIDGTAVEVHVYNLRHVQHGVGQLNLLLRQETDSAPRWVKRADE